MLLPLLTLGVSTYLNLETMVSNFEDTALRANQEYLTLIKLQSLILNLQIESEALLIYDDPQSYQKIKQQVKEIDASFVDITQATFDTSAERRLVQMALQNWRLARQQVLNIVVQNPEVIQRNYHVYRHKLQVYIEPVSTVMNNVHKIAAADLGAELQEAREIKYRGYWIIAYVFSFGLFGAGAVSWLLARSILVPLSQLKTGVDRFSSNQSHRIHLKSGDELSQLALTFNNMAESLQHYQAHLTKLATTDSLTQLPNRFYFTEYIEQAVQRVKQKQDYQFALLFIDLDRFKVINDSLGHRAGDQLLAIVAERIQQSIQREALVARLGGDEFAILLENITGMEEAIQVAEKIEQALQKPIQLSNNKVTTSASIGIALSNNQIYWLDDLLQNADIAMYMAKKQGRARYQIFDRTMQSDVSSRLQLEIDLYNALDQKEFQVYYQPIVHLASNRIVGFEALVRWQHPVHGMIFPADFISLAEETGFIVPLSEFICREACQQARIWQDKRREHCPELPLFISINCSVKQLIQPDLVHRIAQILQETSLASASLNLEITESVLIENPKEVINTLHQLKSLGVSLSLDDFGTGYSSLSYVHKLPIDSLKIDRSFVGKINTSKNLKIVNTIVLLARELGIDVVAEGIETQEQVHALKEIHCSYGQGYLYSRPLNSNAVTALLEPSVVA